MERRSRHPKQKFWPKIVMRKWLNISTRESDFSADTEDDEVNDSDSDSEDLCSGSRNGVKLEDNNWTEFHVDNGALPKSKRRKSETFRAHYIHQKELKVCVGTWNVGGILPPEDLDLNDWLRIKEPSDIYVLGFQEIVPLNAGNIFGAEDEEPVRKWENIIRQALNRVPSQTHYKCFSDPASPSRFKPTDDAPYLDDETVLLNEECIYPKKLNRLNQLRLEEGAGKGKCLLMKSLSGTERIGLNWPEPPLDLISRFPIQRANSMITSRSLRNYGSEFVRENLTKGKRRSSFVRVVSKQMVGILLTVWIRKSLRRHIQNVKVSTVGVGVMGYIGNKGSVGVSMTIYQTTFCFICSHLYAGEREGDEQRRNADVQEIFRRTQFRRTSDGLPQRIYDHERIIFLGDLNYRIDLPYDTTLELIYKKDWPGLVEKDQLVRELRKGRTFDGWHEGVLNFPPTYKYVYNSEKYLGVDLRGGSGRRTPAWCDRVLWYGKGMGLASYRRTDARLSDHRPVTGVFLIDVEVFSARRLQRALTLTDAEIDNDEDAFGVGDDMARRSLEETSRYSKLSR